MSEPFYIAKEVFGLNAETAERWLFEQRDISKERGAMWARVTIDEAASPIIRVLFEAWDHRPDDEGKPRWA